MNTTWRRAAITAAALVALLPCLAFLRAAGPPSRKGLEDAFEKADLNFRALYGGGRAVTLAKLGPVIAVELDNLNLIRNGQKTEAKVIPTLYHRLKAVSHVPLAIYVSLAPYGDGPLDDDRVTQLKTFRTDIADLVGALENSGFNAEQVARSRSLLERCLSFLDGVLERRKYEIADLKALTRAAAPIVLANASDAARAQIDAYHAQVSAWRRDLPADEWAKLHVLVLGPQMPRKHNVATQYFAKLLNVPGEDRRVVYAEELSGEKQGLNLLSTHQLDSELSEAFFGDRDRMEIDLLGNAASVYLDSFDVGR